VHHPSAARQCVIQVPKPDIIEKNSSPIPQNSFFFWWNWHRKCVHLEFEQVEAVRIYHDNEQIQLPVSKFNCLPVICPGKYIIDIIHAAQMYFKQTFSWRSAMNYFHDFTAP
jgi:hypothetical protein